MQQATSKKRTATAQVEVLDWATSRFWAEYAIDFNGDEFSVAVGYDEGEGFELTVTGSDERQIDGNEFAVLLGYRDKWAMCEDLTDGMFGVPDMLFSLQVGEAEVAQ
jgi:hypothetical protein